MPPPDTNPPTVAVPTNAAESIQILADLESEPPGTISLTQTLLAIKYLGRLKSTDGQRIRLASRSFVPYELLNDASSSLERCIVSMLLAMNSLASQVFPGADREDQSSALVVLAELTFGNFLDLPGSKMARRPDGSVTMEWTTAPLSSYLIALALRLVRRIMAHFPDAGPRGITNKTPLDHAGRILSFLLQGGEKSLSPQRIKKMPKPEAELVARDLGGFAVGLGEYFASLDNKTILDMGDDLAAACIEAVKWIGLCYGAGTSSSAFTYPGFTPPASVNPRTIQFHETMKGVYRDYAQTAEAQGKGCASPFPQLIRGLSLWARAGLARSAHNTSGLEGLHNLILHLRDFMPDLVAPPPPPSANRNGAARRDLGVSVAFTARTLAVLVESMCVYLRPAFTLQDAQGMADVEARMRYMIWLNVVMTIGEVFVRSGWLPTSDFVSVHADTVADMIEVVATLPAIPPSMRKSQALCDRLSEVVAHTDATLQSLLSSSQVARLQVRQAAERSGAFQKLADCIQAGRAAVSRPARGISSLPGILRLATDTRELHSTLHSLQSVYDTLCTSEERRAPGSLGNAEMTELGTYLDAIVKLDRDGPEGDSFMVYGSSLVAVTHFLGSASLRPGSFAKAPFEVMPVIKVLERLLDDTTGTPPCMVLQAVDVITGLQGLVLRALSDLRKSTATAAASRASQKLDASELRALRAREETEGQLKVKLEGARKRLASIMRRALREHFPALEARTKSMWALAAEIAWGTLITKTPLASGSRQGRTSNSNSNPQSAALSSMVRAVMMQDPQLMQLLQFLEQRARLAGPRAGRWARGRGGRGAPGGLWTRLRLRLRLRTSDVDGQLEGLALLGASYGLDSII